LIAGWRRVVFVTPHRVGIGRRSGGNYEFAKLRNEAVELS
jgi:hypothetical protein